MKNKKRATSVFNNYAEKFDPSDIKVRLKVSHTFRVADIAERIAKSIGLDEQGRYFAWFLGLLHDIGRFEQLKRYGTFVDIKSIDHAELGADILFIDGLIDEFPKDGLPVDWREITELAVRLHNKLNVPEDMDEVTTTYVRLLRDADKCDIFRVLTEPPYDERNSRITSEAFPSRAEIMTCVDEHRCVPRVSDRTDFENLISQCCMGFELYYPESRRIAGEQGYLRKLLDTPIENEEAGKQFEYLRNEMSGFVALD